MNCSDCKYRVLDGGIGIGCGNGWSVHYGEYGVGGCEDYTEEESEAGDAQ